MDVFKVAQPCGETPQPPTTASSYPTSASYAPGRTFGAMTDSDDGTDSNSSKVRALCWLGMRMPVCPHCTPACLAPRVAQ